MCGILARVLYKEKPMSRTKLLCLAAAVALLSASSWVAPALSQSKGVNPNEPITMTKGMYADLLCVMASDVTYGDGYRFSYDADADAVRVAYVPPPALVAATRAKNDGQYTASNAANRKTVFKERAEARMKLVLPRIQAHVSPTAVSAVGTF
jgi:hypothetical protein